MKPQKKKQPQSASPERCAAHDLSHFSLRLGLRPCRPTFCSWPPKPLPPSILPIRRLRCVKLLSNFCTLRVKVNVEQFFSENPAPGPRLSRKRGCVDFERLFSGRPITGVLSGITQIGSFGTPAASVQNFLYTSPLQGRPL